MEEKEFIWAFPLLNSQGIELGTKFSKESNTYLNSPCRENPHIKTILKFGTSDFGKMVGPDLKSHCKILIATGWLYSHVFHFVYSQFAMLCKCPKRFEQLRCLETCKIGILGDTSTSTEEMTMASILDIA